MSCVSFRSEQQRAALAAVRPRPSIDEVLAEHPVPPVTEGTRHRIRLLAADEDPRIRASAAAHRHAPDDVLSRLAGDSDETVRGWVARNDTCSVEILGRLAGDPSATVRGWVGAHPAAPAELLDRLSGDAEPLVREVVAWNRRWEQTAG